MSKGSGMRKYTKEGQDKIRNNKFWETCEFEKKKRNISHDKQR